MTTNNTKDQKIEQYNKLPYLSKIVKCLLILYIFLLPIQTRFIYHQGVLNGGEWEYGTKSLYATEILLLVIIFLYVIGATRWLIHSKSEVQESRLQAIKKNLKNPLISLPIALLLWAALSILWSYDKSLAWYRWTILLEGVVLYLILISNFKFQISKEIPKSTVPNDKKNRFSSIILIPLLAGAILQAILAIYQFASQQIIANKWLGIAGHIPETLGSSVVETSLRRWLRSYGSLPHPNILAAYLGICLLLLLIIRVQYRGLTPFKGVKPLSSALAIFLLSTAILLTFSRAAWLGLIVVAALFFLPSFSSGWGALAPRSYRTSAKVLESAPCLRLSAQASRQLKCGRNFLFSTGFAFLFLLVIFLLREPIITRLKGNDRLEIKSNQEHILSYKEASAMIKNHFVLGTGIGNYTLALSRQNPGLPSYSYQPAHNFFMLILAELGIIGLIIILLFLFFIIKQGLKTLPNIIIIFLMVLMLFDHYFWSLYFGAILWWLTVGIHLTLIRDPYKSVSNLS